MKNNITFALCIFVLQTFSIFGQPDKYKKMSKHFHPNDFLVRCEVGDIGVLLFYDTGIGQADMSAPSYEYPVFSNNHYMYQTNFWYRYKTKSGDIKVIPSGDLNWISKNAGVSGILTASVTDENAPDWAVSAMDTRSDWYDKFDNDWNQRGTNVWGTVLTHAWSEDYRGDFIFWEITFTNKSREKIQDLYFGKRMDCDVSSGEGGSGALGFWRDDLVDFYTGTSDFLDEQDNRFFIHYMYDSDNPNIPGDDTGGWKTPKETPAFIGTITISSPPTKDGLFPANQPSAHVWWDWNSSPSSNQEIYDYLSWGHNNPDDPYRSVPPSPHDYRYLACWGPYDIEPGESITIRLASGCGFAPQEYFDNPDHPTGKGIQGLKENLVWAKKLWQTDWVGPSAPPAAKLNGRGGNNIVYLEWDNSSETALDPFTGEADFEGYKLWKSTDRVNWELLLQCDLINDIGKNTGLAHSYTDYAVVNGFKYYYALTCYDRGNPYTGIEILESSRCANMFYVMPGSSPETRLDKNKISVAPNPYYAYAKWNWTPDFNSPSEHRIGFFGLPVWADIFIYTLAGDYVDKIEHRNTDSGVAYWDCISRKIHDVASGVYLYVVEDKDGSKVMGKFVVIR